MMHAVTTANILTIFRLVLVPCFALAVIYYSTAFKADRPDNEWLRWLAIIFFTIAAITDGVDGYIARRFSQKSRLGTILDPAADKALLLTALLTLSWNPGHAFPQLPLWFPIVVLSRDLFLVFGVALILIMGKSLEVRPHWIGKVATVLQMMTLGLVLLKVPELYWSPLLWVSGLFTVISGGIYMVQGARMLGN